MSIKVKKERKIVNSQDTCAVTGKVNIYMALFTQVIFPCQWLFLKCGQS